MGLAIRQPIGVWAQHLAKPRDDGSSPSHGQPFKE